MPGFSRPLRGSARTTLRAISRAGTRSSRATCTGPSRPSATEGGPQILHGSETMSTERIANGIGPARINLAYERRGDPGDPAVLLIMGLGAQLVHWPTGFAARSLADRISRRPRRARPPRRPLRQPRLGPLHIHDRSAAAGSRGGARGRPVLRVLHAVGHGG